MPRPLTATIHPDALRHNLARARACAPHSKVWAVVKANAYGHGIECAMRAFASADGLALIEFDKALEVLALGWRGPLLLLEGCFDSDDVRLAAQHGLNVTVHSAHQIDLLEQAAIDGPIDVHLKMNTGMNRLGFVPEAFQAAHARLRGITAVRHISLMTHFANADELDHPRLTVHQQIARFNAGALGLPGERSLCNSGGVLHQGALGAVQNDWVRPGIILYGGTPGGAAAGSFGLLPTMTLASEIIGVQQLVAGDTVGYGSRFVASGPMTVGIVACGYADGYPRHAPHGTPVLVDGHASTLVGRVSMDMLAVDLTALPQTGIGSRVVLWGAGLPIDTVAEAAGTIGYELMCAIAPRVQVVEADLATLQSTPLLTTANAANTANANNTAHSDING
jgi:alanine racemase